MGFPGNDDVLRRHVAGCPECAQRLRHEAVLELALGEAALSGAGADSPVTLRTAIPRRRPLLAAAAAVAILAIGAAWLIPRLKAPTSAAHGHGPGYEDPMRLAPGYSVELPPDPCRQFATPMEGEASF